VTPELDLSGKRVLVLGAQGLVGNALAKRLNREECDLFTATREDGDLTKAGEAEALINRLHPDVLVLAAAKVGGILANKVNPVSFLEENLLIQTHVCRAAHRANVDRLLFLGSSCIYPKLSTQPIAEISLMTGPLEPSNDAYALAKITGIRLIDAYRQQYGRHWISAMPTNLYGPNDNFNPQTSHVLPALLRKFHEAKMEERKIVEIWGTGNVRREFMHVNDCADALIHVLTHYNDDGPINIGTGKDISINELAQIISELTGFSGELTHDFSKPDGTPSKRLDVSRLSQLGWTPKIDLHSGLAQTYNWYVENIA